MQWLKERGLISSYEDFLGLPIAVLQDARLLMHAEATQAEKERERARRS